MTARSVGAAPAWLALVLALGTFACANVLGLNDYDPIERQLCQCTADVDQFPIAECETQVREALESGGEQVASFLTHFDDNECAKDCNDNCFKHPLLCDEAACTVGKTCCGKPACCASADGPSMTSTGAIVGTCCDECFSCSALLKQSDRFAAPCPQSAAKAADLKACICGRMDLVEVTCDDECRGRCSPGASIDQGCASCVNNANDMENPCGSVENKCSNDIGD